MPRDFLLLLYGPKHAKMNFIMALSPYYINTCYIL